MSDLWRIVLFLVFAVSAVVVMRWVAGTIAVKLGYPRAYGQQILASAGVCLLFTAKKPEPLIPVSKEDERLAAVVVDTSGPRSRPSGLTDDSSLS